MMYDWLWARAEMKKARNKERGKALKGNQSTYLRVSYESPTDDWQSDECVYGLFLWGTEIVRYYPNGVVAASLNGWVTITTKMRISEFSPLRIGSVRGCIYGASQELRRQWWIGGEDTWFYCKDGKMCFKGGGSVPNVMSVRKAKPIPKSRDTVSAPLEGDAYEDALGKWICAPQRVNSTFGYTSGHWLVLYPYYGDHPDDRGIFITDPDPTPRELLSPTELLATAADEGLRPIERFVWSKPV
jgi:hypothetical protein